MRNSNRILFLVLCLLISIFTTSVVSAQNCVCLDANGVKYPATASANSVCYMCGQDGCTPTALTLSVCQSAAGQMQQIIPTQQPVQHPVVSDEKPVVQLEDAQQNNEQEAVSEIVLMVPDGSGFGENGNNDFDENGLPDEFNFSGNDDNSSGNDEISFPETLTVGTEQPGEQYGSENENSETGQITETTYQITEGEGTIQPDEQSGSENENSETGQIGETKGQIDEGEGTEQPDVVIDPENESSDTGQFSEITGASDDGEGVERLDEVVDPGNEQTEPEISVDENKPFTTLSQETWEELSHLLTEDELVDFSSILTLAWLEANADTLSNQTYLELLALLNTEEPVINMLGVPGPVPSVTIEGELTDLLLFSPTGGTVTTSDVPFIWLYAYDGETGPADVTFLLQLTITTAADTALVNTTVSSVSCGSNICTYTADLSAYNHSLVSWTVGGVYQSGETSVTVPGPAAQSFSLEFGEPEPPKPAKKPKAPVQECPYGTYEKRKLGFYWAPSKYAESYTVNWSDNKGHKGSANLSDSDSSCQNGRCVVHLTMPGNGNYAWTVTAKNSLGSATSPEMSFQIVSTISVPAPYRPSGTITNNSYVAFEWQDTGKEVTDYRIQVAGDNENYFRMDRWFKVSDIYVGRGVCYVQTDLYLPAGSYSWRVQASNGNETSGWSSWKGFSVSSYNSNNNYYYNYTNTIPSCLYPTGTITTAAPNFQWRTVTGAAYYMVKLYDSSGVVQFDRQVSSSGNCTAEMCTWIPDYKLTKNGNYTWSVLSYGGNNALWSSASGLFTLQGAVVQKTMSFVSPVQNGLLSQNSPVIIWTDPGANTAIFHVEIFDKANKQLFSADLNRTQAWCDGQTCSIEFKTIPDAENYHITITPYSELNTKGNAISLVFSKGSKILKLNSPKEGSTVQSRPLFRWNMDTADMNVSYELILTDAANNVTTISPLGCNMEGVTCEDGEMFFSPAFSLTPGAYTAKLGFYNSTTVSPELHFTVK